MLVKTDGLLYLRDLGSTNGTRVNGQRVVRGALLPGDQLSFSGISYQVYLGPDVSPASVSANGATEMIPVIDADAFNDETTGKLDNSSSDVRFLRDTDIESN